jgi:hypothetical protein
MLDNMYREGEAGVRGWEGPGVPVVLPPPPPPPPPPLPSSPRPPAGCQPAPSGLARLHARAQTAGCTTPASLPWCAARRAKATCRPGLALLLGGQAGGRPPRSTNTRQSKPSPLPAWRRPPAGDEVHILHVIPPGRTMVVTTELGLEGVVEDDEETKRRAVRAGGGRGGQEGQPPPRSETLCVPCKHAGPPWWAAARAPARRVRAPPAPPAGRAQPAGGREAGRRSCVHAPLRPAPAGGWAGCPPPARARCLRPAVGAC